MFLKKKAHNLFSKSIKLALKGVKGSTTENKNNNNEPVNVTDVVTEEVDKPKKNNKSAKRVNAEDLV